MQAQSVISTNVYGYYYVERNNSITTDKNRDKIRQRIDDLFYHYDNMDKQLKNIIMDEHLKKRVYAYYTNTILYRLKDIEKKERKKYIEIINKKKMLNNILTKNIKSVVKYLILKFNINLYIELKNKREK